MAIEQFFDICCLENLHKNFLVNSYQKLVSLLFHLETVQRVVERVVISAIVGRLQA